jgi:hypothetical protein
MYYEVRISIFHDFLCKYCLFIHCVFKAVQMRMFFIILVEEMSPGICLRNMSFCKFQTWLGIVICLSNFFVQKLLSSLQMVTDTHYYNQKVEETYLHYSRGAEILVT